MNGKTTAAAIYAGTSILALAYINVGMDESLNNALLLSSQDIMKDNELVATINALKASLYIAAANAAAGIALYIAALFGAFDRKS